MATRCCSPPESSPARCPPRPPNPTSSSHSPAVCSDCFNPSPRIRSGMATFSAAVKSGSKWCRCQTKPTTRLRYSASFSSASDHSEFRAKYTSPLVGVSSAASRWSRVLFPAPEGPMIAIISPRSTTRSILSSGVISCRPERKTFVRFCVRRSTAEYSATPTYESSTATPVLAWLGIVPLLSHRLDAELQSAYVLHLLAADSEQKGNLSNCFHIRGVSLPDETLSQRSRKNCPQCLNYFPSRF